MTQLLMIVGVFVAGRDAEDSAGENFGLRMRCVKRIARIGDGFINSSDQIKPPIDFPQQHQAAIGSERSAIKIHVDRLTCESLEFRLNLFTLCHCESLEFTVVEAL